jgi:hypothetical protein
MSVLFVAYRRLKKLDGVSAQDVYELDRTDVIGIYDKPNCPRLTEGLELGAAYEFLEDHWFTFGHRFEFLEGLEKLAAFANYKMPRPGENKAGPFCEIFLNEGSDVFGTIVSAKLAAD